jgi:transporter family-2 protein
MGRTLALFLTAGAGVLVAMQAPINGHLGEHVGRIQAALISFIVGTAILLLITFVFADGLSGGTGIGAVPWPYFIGGLLGAAYVVTVIFTVKTLGAGGVTAATITGQLTAAVLIDQFGAFGLEKQPVNLQRVAGICLLAAGTYLIVADRA